MTAREEAAGTHEIHCPHCTLDISVSCPRDALTAALEAKEREVEELRTENGQLAAGPPWEVMADRDALKAEVEQLTGQLRVAKQDLAAETEDLQAEANDRLDKEIENATLRAEVEKLTAALEKAQAHVESNARIATERFDQGNMALHAGIAALTVTSDDAALADLRERAATEADKREWPHTSAAIRALPLRREPGDG